MDGLLHPVGPEAGRTYWLRRAAVALAAILIVGLVVGGIVQGTARAGDPTAAEPAAPSSPVASPYPAPEKTLTPEGEQPPPSDAPPAADPTDDAVGEAEQEATEESQTGGDDQPEPEPQPEPPAEAAPPQKLEAPQCEPGDLAVLVEGPEEVAPTADPQTFAVTVVNTGSANCTLSMSAENLTVTVYTGPDRVWTTEHCSAVLPGRQAVLAPQAWLSADVTWGVSRSAENCGTEPGEVATGDYVVTAELTDVAPAQHPFTVA